MIGQLTGLIIEKQPPHLLLDVNGVGYEISASMNTFYKLPELGKKIMLRTHLVVREDAQLLFGFYDEAERKLFRHLIKVSGVGPKLALGILSGMNPQEFVACIEYQDSKSLVRIPGVGRKTAERLVIEMRDRLKDFSVGLPLVKGAAPIAVGDQQARDAVSALISLGYKPAEANRVVTERAQEDLSVEDLIKESLRELVG